MDKYLYILKKIKNKKSTNVIHNRFQESCCTLNTVFEVNHIDHEMESCIQIRAANWDSRVAGPGWIRKSESTSKDS